MNDISAKEAALVLLGKILKDNNYSVTASRKLVFELLWNHEPQTMYELYTKSQGKIDRVSIYRTIALFQQLGLVQRIIIGWKYKLELTDVFTHHHHHISCLDCGKVVAIKENDEIEQLIHDFAEKYDMTAERHQFEIQGYCRDCRKKRRSM